MYDNNVNKHSFKCIVTIGISFIKFIFHKLFIGCVQNSATRLEMAVSMTFAMN